MENSSKTWQYLKEMGAVLIETKIKVDDCFVGDNIYVFKREYYRKRNGRTCYVDYKGIYFNADWSRIKKKSSRNVYSSGENDWRPLRTISTRFIFASAYKDELINKFLNTPV